MKAADVMTKDVATCRPDETAAAAVQAMKEHDCGVIPLTDDHRRLVGVVTDRDLLLAAHARGKPLSAMRLSEVPMSPAKSVREDAELEAVAATMAEHQVRRLPVLDGEDHLVGLVSLGDLALHAFGNDRRMLRSATVLAAVSRHRDAAG